MLWISNRTFQAHADNDLRQFDIIIKSLRDHDENVANLDKKNHEAICNLQTGVDSLLRLKPDLEAGILADHAVAWRKKTFRRVAWAILSTVLTISGMLPLITWLAGFHILISHGG